MRQRTTRCLPAISLHSATSIFGFRRGVPRCCGSIGQRKTTLLNLLAGIDRPTSGSVTIDGVDIAALGESGLARWRGTSIGLVFQFFQLLPTLTVLENVMLPMDFAGVTDARQRRERALALLERVGIAEQAGKLPATLSVVSSSALLSPGRSRTIRPCCSPTNRPAISTPLRRHRCSSCSPPSRRRERRSSWSPTTRRRLPSPTGRSPLPTGALSWTRRWSSMTLRPRTMKILRDLRLSLGRVAVMTMAIAVAVIGLGAILIAKETLSRDTNAAYASTNPASATLDLPDGVDAGLLSDVRALPGVEDARRGKRSPRGSASATPGYRCVSSSSLPTTPCESRTSRWRQVAGPHRSTAYCSSVRRPDSCTPTRATLFSSRTASESSRASPSAAPCGIPRYRRHPRSEPATPSSLPR